MTADNNTIEVADWLNETGTIMAALAAAGGVTRFVGGCVRNRILGMPVTDIDLATTLPAPRVLEVLTQAGVKVVETGVAHGTVTAVVAGKGYEITTLREDVTTDGRHATVRFVDDWAQDARRRDFTFNALYADATGQLYDYVGGVADALARRVRFVGAAAERVREDYLRILRLYRFYAQYGDGVIDPSARAACAAGVGALSSLSAERVWAELQKWLVAPKAQKAWRWAREDSVVAALLPEADDSIFLRLATVLSAPQALAALVPLAALGVVTSRLKLSRVQIKLVTVLAQALSQPPWDSPLAARDFYYTHGAELLHQAVALQAAARQRSLPDWVAALTQEPIVTLPLTGDDVIAALGGQGGARVGELLAALRAWWLQQPLLPDRAACLTRLQQLLKN